MTIAPKRENFFDSTAIPTQCNTIRKCNTTEIKLRFIFAHAKKSNKLWIFRYWCIRCINIKRNQNQKTFESFANFAHLDFVRSSKENTTKSNFLVFKRGTPDAFSAILFQVTWHRTKNKIRKEIESTRIERWSHHEQTRTSSCKTIKANVSLES